MRDEGEKEERKGGKEEGGKEGVGRGERREATNKRERLFKGTLWFCWVICNFVLFNISMWNLY